MVETIGTEELEKVRHDLFRVTEYLSERRGWSVSGESIPELDRMKDLIAKLRTQIVGLMQQPDDNDPVELEFEKRDSALLDSVRVARFAAFIEQINRWFASRAGFQLEESGNASLQAIDVFLNVLGESVDRLFENNRPDSGAVARVAPPSNQEYSPETSVDIGLPAPDSSHDDEPILNLKLVLENTETVPLLQEFQGRTELTFEAKQQLDEFLAEASVELAETDRRRFDEKVLRWIEATPHGQLLVLKTGAMDGPYKLYPTYRPVDEFH